jgi:hypothetical protein
MSEITLGHKIVGLENSFDVGAVYANRYAHDEMLRSFCHTPIDA